MNMESNHLPSASVESPISPATAGDILTTAEVASLLKKSRRTIELWARRGYISSIKIGRSVFFERTQLLTDLRRFRVGPSSS